METVEVVVRIPKDVYDIIQEVGRIISGRRSGKTIEFALWNGVKNGTVLPKGHGRLIDADAFIEKLKDASKRQKYKEALIGDGLTVDDVFKAIIESLENIGLAEGDSPTVIEADKDGE